MVGTEIASLYATMGADIGKFQRSMGTVDSMLHSAGGKLSGFVGMLGTGLAGAAVVGVGGLAALGAGIVSVTGNAADMQQSIADIASDMRLTADETERVGTLINDLGIDPKLKVSAEEAADAIHMLGKNGLDLGQILDGAARSTVLLANSTKADFGTAADIATDVMALFNIEAQNMMTAVNGITGVTQQSKFDINSYKLALAQAGGVAASVGVSFEDFNATIAAISPLFASGSDAGTSFKTFLQRLVPDTKPAMEAMRELGIVTADGQNQFFTASGEMKSMAEIAAILQTAFAGLSEEQKISAATNIFGTDAMRAAFAIADAGAGTINKLKEEIGKTDAEQAAATRMNTLSGAMEVFWGIVDSLKVQIGTGFLPVAQKMTERLSELATKYGPSVVEWARQFAEQIEVLFNYIVAAVEDGDTMNDWLDHMHPLLKGAVLGTIDFVNGLKEFMPIVVKTISVIKDFVDAIGGIQPILKIVAGIIAGSAIVSIVSFISTIVSAIATIGSFIGSITGIGTALSAVVAFFNPVGLAIAAVGVAAGGLYLAWKYNFLGIRDITSDVIGKVRGWLSGLTPYLDSFKRTFYEWGATAFRKIAEGFNASKEFVKGQLTLVMNDVKEHGWSYATGAFAGRLYEGGRSALLKLGEGIKTASPNIASDLSSALQGMIDVFNKAMDGFKTHVWNVMKDVGGRIADGLVSGLKSGYSKIQSAISFLTNSIPQWVKDQLGIHSPSKVFQEIGMNIMQGLDKGIGDNLKLPKLSMTTAVNHILTPAGDGAQIGEYTVGVSSGGNQRIDVYVHANSSMPTDRAAIRQLAIELQREMSMNGGKVIFS
jgi:TP901 family phage tail tape measure protein